MPARQGPGHHPTATLPGGKPAANAEVARCCGPGPAGAMPRRARSLLEAMLQRRSWRGEIDRAVKSSAGAPL